MRILLDECVDWRLARAIVGHEVRTARQMGWTAIRNGELMRLASASFDAFVTVDRNLAFQQPLISFPVAIIVLRAKTSRLADLLPLVPSLLHTLETTNRGRVQFIDTG